MVEVIILDMQNNSAVVEAISDEELENEYDGDIENYVNEVAESSNIQWMVINGKTKFRNLIPKNPLDLNAIFVKKSLISAEEFLDDEDIKYQKWESDRGSYELRVVLMDLSKEEKDSLEEWCGQKLTGYSYLIIWE